MRLLSHRENCSHRNRERGGGREKAEACNHRRNGGSWRIVRHCYFCLVKKDDKYNMMCKGQRSNLCRRPIV